MSAWPTTRKNDAPRRGAGETALEAMASAPRPPDCPRSAPALRGRFFAWEEKGTQARSVDARRRRAITEPGRIAKLPPGSARRAPPRRLNAGFEGFSLNIEPAQTTSRRWRLRCFNALPFLWGKRVGCLGIRRRRAITAPASAQSAARGGLKCAIPPPQSRLRGLFVEFGSSGQRDAD